ncbi:MAG: Serine/threonine-protein kinase PrkC [Chloroflexi bacterium]|nr:Serine/threonine-protein kinase PrkC [Chloroflexota bacterium]
MPFMLGENVGPYRLMEQLGQGGMATVYKAYHARLDRYVAFKALHPAFMQDPNFEARFQREARVVAKLEHTNIVPIYDFAEHGGRPYLVLKYVEGETLKARLLRNDLSKREIQDIFEAVSSALAYAHEQGILHRDVKPSNVLIAEEGRIYLADFGLARIAQAGESTLSTDMMLGTPQYISPEQAKGVSDLDQGSDIYSLGVMMYELLVGRVPFSADTPFSIIHDHIYSPLPLPREVNPEISNAVERVLLKALAKDRQDRYPDIAAMREVFQRVFEGDEVIDKRVSLVKEEEEPTLPPTPGVREAQTAQPLGEDSPPPESAYPPDQTPGPAPESGQPPAETDPSPEVAPSVLTSTAEAVPPSPTKEEKVAAPSPKAAKKRFIPSWVWWMVLPALILVCLGGVVLKRATDAPGPEAIVESVEREDRDLAAVKSDVAQNPDDPKLRMELAIAYWEEGQFSEAKPEANKAFDFAKEDPQLYSEFGDMLAEHGIWVYAAISYALAEQHMPNPPEGIYDLIHQAVYYAAFNPMAADVLSSSGLEFEPGLIEVVEGRAALMNEDFAQTESFLNAALAQQPDLPEAHLLEVDLLRKRGEKVAALRVLEELEKSDNLPDWIQEEIRQIRADETTSTRKVDDQRGIAEAMQAVDENPDDPITKVKLAIAYWEAGRTGDAKDTAYGAFDLAGDNARQYKIMGDMFAAEEVWLLAAPAYLLADVNSEGSVDGSYDLISKAVYLAAFYEEAVEVLGDPRLALDPLLLNLVEVRHEMVVGNPDRAEELLRSVLDEKPGMLEARLLEADLLRERGEFEAARTVLLELERNDQLPAWVEFQIQALWRKIDQEET